MCTASFKNNTVFVYPFAYLQTVSKLSSQAVCKYTNRRSFSSTGLVLHLGH